MQMSYVAFGLELRSSFSLPGMTEANDPALPELVLERTTPTSLEAVWSGQDGPVAWSGRLGDGRVLTIERGPGGDVLFRYGEHEHCSTFHLAPDRQRLSCAPGYEGLAWQRVLITKVIPSISVMRGYEALHAGAVASPGGVVAIAGPSGSGKSTLLAELVRRGWSLVTDDELTLARDEEAVYAGEGAICAHPGSPHMNLAQDHPSDLDPSDIGEVLSAMAGESWLSVHNPAREPRPVRMICLLERQAGLRLSANLIPPNPLALAPYVLGLSTAARRHRSRFALYSDLVEHTALMHLTAGLRDTPADLADTVEGALLHDTSDAPLPTTGVA